MTGTPAAPTLPPSLARRYRAETVLGAGGFGEVVLATDLELERQVALKLLHAPLRAGDMRLRFEREARITSQLEHPYVIRVYDFGVSDEGVAYLCSEFIDGRDLLTEVQENGNATAIDAIRWGIQLASALEAAHAAGVVHRDVKPQNVLLRGRSRDAVLCDFGIVRLEEGHTVMTADGTILGTPPYLPAEVYLGETPGTAADQYALGATLWHALTGTPPFGTGSPSEILGRIREGTPERLEDVRRIAPGLAVPLRKTLAADPASRFPDLRALREELARVAAESGAALPPLPPTMEVATRVLDDRPRDAGATPVALPRPPLPAPPRDHRPLLAGAALVVVLALGLAPGESPPPPPPPPPPVTTPAPPGPSATAAALDALVAPILETHGGGAGSTGLQRNAADPRRDHVLAIRRELLAPRFPVRFNRILDASLAWLAELREAAAPHAPLVERAEDKERARVALFGAVVHLVVDTWWLLQPRFLLGTDGPDPATRDLQAEISAGRLYLDEAIGHVTAYLDDLVFDAHRDPFVDALRARIKVALGEVLPPEVRERIVARALGSGDPDVVEASYEAALALLDRGHTTRTAPCPRILEELERLQRNLPRVQELLAPVRFFELMGRTLELGRDLAGNRGDGEAAGACGESAVVLAPEVILPLLHAARDGLPASAHLGANWATAHFQLLEKTPPDFHPAQRALLPILADFRAKAGPALFQAPPELQLQFAAGRWGPRW